MKYYLSAILAVAMLAVDQWSKVWTTANLTLGETLPFLPGLVELQRVHNYGAAWSSFSGYRWFLLCITSIMIAVVAYMLVRRTVRHPLGVAACSLIISGGIGNLLDRFRLGYVVDMLHFVFWPSYPVFNVADICVVCGAAVFAVYFLFIHDTYEKTAGGQNDGSSDPSGT